jgi:hypothetical protein
MKDWRPPVQPDRYTPSGEVGSLFFLSAKVIIFCIPQGDVFEAAGEGAGFCIGNDT